ncbi:MAG: magnesium/cobalt transporter CorA [Syntrophaceae bacterium]|nr:magnesium/cobalt transporter CorA [Syntrophaceae bacterium]
MSKLIKKSSKKAGLPPGTLVHIGEKKTEKTRVAVVEYDGHGFQEKELKNFDDCYLFPKESAVTWVNVIGIQQVEVLEKLGTCFVVHPLALEDILNTEQRPKVEDYGEDLFIVVKLISYDDKRDEVEAEQISLILRPQALLSFQEKEGDDFAAVKERLRGGKGRLRKMGADYLAYTLLDIVVDQYFVVLEKLGERIEVLEGKLLTDPSTSTLQKIQNLKREMLLLRKWVWPLREVISSLERGEFPGIQASSRVYFRDVYDHTIQVMDSIEIYRDMLSGMLDIYLSSLNNRMSAVMKVLTIIATIFMPLTFLAGVYGMNFKHMPELDWPWGYPLVLTIMAVVAVLMLTLFRRKKWL